MTEERPTTKWRTGLAKDVAPSAAHRARAWPGVFGWSEITCDLCAWTRRSNDFAGLVASAINHSQRVKVMDVDGQELADGAREQREARRRWDAGDATTASEAIASRIGGRMDRNGTTGEETGEGKPAGMSDLIRSAREGRRVGGPDRRREIARRAFGPPPEENAGETGEGTTEAGDAGGEGD